MDSNLSQIISDFLDWARLQIAQLSLIFQLWMPAIILFVWWLVSFDLGWSFVKPTGKVVFSAKVS